eukprot:scaffold65545_cov56-Phaeocystis_antarctica.AAC.4
MGRSTACTSRHAALRSCDGTVLTCVTLRGVYRSPQCRPLTFFVIKLLRGPDAPPPLSNFGEAWLGPSGVLAEASLHLQGVWGDKSCPSWNRAKVRPDPKREFFPLFKYLNKKV